MRSPMMFLLLYYKNEGMVQTIYFYSACPCHNYYICMTQINKLKNQSTFLFLSGRYLQGYNLIKECIQVQPNQAQHYINKGLFQHKLGNTKAALNDFNKAITLDCLNYQAYFNLFSMHMQLGQYESAFKNMCCCLSIAYLLRAYNSSTLDDIQKSIEYSFNNKQARLFKSILKVQQNKNIQALNSINYALYLAPANPHLKQVQEQVYKFMGMKELKANNAHLKDRFDRLQTNKEIPPPDRIKEEIGKLFKEFNKLLKCLDTKNLYKTRIESKIEDKAVLTQPKITKKISPKFYVQKSENREQKIVSLSETFKDKEQKQSTANNSEHVLLANQQTLKLNGQLFERNQHFFLEDSFQNLSISNIQQNSNIKMNRYKQSVGEQSISNILESSLGSQVGVTLPLNASQLKGKQIVITLQRTIQNQKGQKQQIQQQFNVIEKNSRFQLVKIRRDGA